MNGATLLALWALAGPIAPEDRAATVSLRLDQLLRLPAAQLAAMPAAERSALVRALNPQPMPGQTVRSHQHLATAKKGNEKWQH